MNRLSAAISLLALTIPLAGSVARSQSGIAPTDASHGKPTLVKLAPPPYPAIARAAGVTGDVVVAVEINGDGSVQSAVALSGHPLLVNTALESARQSQFDCRGCGESAAPIHLTYTFWLAGVDGCCNATANTSMDPPSEPIPGVTRAQNHITVLAYPVRIVDPQITVMRKVRSLKCVYLWKCGLR